MISRNQLKRQKRRFAGKKIVTDDVRKLKSLAEEPDIPKDQVNNYYVEPITIEYYIPKESRFAHETKFLYIELLDPSPTHPNHVEIFNKFTELDEPIDVVQVMNFFPKFMMDIIDYMGQGITYHEYLSVEYQAGLRDGQHEAIRRALYLNEVLRKREQPSLASLEILGDYTRYNINWCCRFLNRHKIPYSLEDGTVHYLLTLHVQHREDQGDPVDERFMILSEIYLEQAFPPDFDDSDLD